MPTAASPKPPNPSRGIQPADLGFFSALARAGSLSAAGRELGISTPAVSKHLALMEARAGVALVNRTTRRMSLTPEGELVLEHARKILASIDDLGQQLGVSKATPQGLLRVNATLGFGRSHVAPIVSAFVRKYPLVEVQLQLSVNPPALSEDLYDVNVRFGAPPDSRVVAKYLAPNRRLLCASPAYLAKHGAPKVPDDLVRHNCIGIRQGEEAHGLWRLAGASRGAGRQAGRAAAAGGAGAAGKAAKASTAISGEAVKVRGNLHTNDGGIAVQWALDGHGILMRAEWDIERCLKSGRLVQVLPQYYTPDADIYAVYPQRHQLSARVRAFVEFLAKAFAQQGGAEKA